jgi:hypothetical protein
VVRRLFDIHWRYKVLRSFTCSELSFELSLPNSILESIDYPYTFPSPPNLDSDDSDNEARESERRSWYYYLAEIAIRHLFNRVLSSRLGRPILPTVESINAALTELAMYEIQLQEWHDSLPEFINFPMPQGDISPLSDELRQYLRGRFLAIRELMYRPFIQLCVTHVIDVPSPLLIRVSDVASQALQYCVFRLQATAPPQSLHHGLWFQMRNATTCSLILIAADRARTDQNAKRIAAMGLKMPIGWRERILEEMESLTRYWGVKRGGIWECYQILQWALEGFQVPTYELEPR